MSKVILICKLVYYEINTPWVTHDVRPYPRGQVIAEDLTIAADKGPEFLIRGISEYGTGSDTTSWKVLSSLAFTIFQKVKWGKKAQKKGNRVT